MLHSAPWTIHEIEPADTKAVTALCVNALVLDKHMDQAVRALMQHGRLTLGAYGRAGELTGVCIASTCVTAAGRQGYIDLIAVAPLHQRQGIGKGLLDAVESRLLAARCELLCIAGNPPFYAWPGVDANYMGALLFFEKAGYRRGRCELNMSVKLDPARLQTRAIEQRLSASGVEFRRASAADGGWLRDRLAGRWKSTWIAEVDAALEGECSGVIMATQYERCIGFCAYGITRPNQIGPLGTDPDMRRMGIGTVLLRQAMDSVRQAGLSTGELPWAGPLSYFAHTIDATISRVFLTYTKR